MAPSTRLLKKLQQKAPKNFSFSLLFINSSWISKVTLKVYVSNYDLMASCGSSTAHGPPLAPQLHMSAHFDKSCCQLTLWLLFSLYAFLIFQKIIIATTVKAIYMYKLYKYIQLSIWVFCFGKLKVFKRFF